MKRPVAELVGTGRYVPDMVYDNAYFEQLVDTSDEWIRERTGILERHIASDDETLAVMGTRAAEQVLDDVGITALDLDGIVLGTATPDRLLPSTACDLQAELGARNAAAFDIAAACSSFLYSLSVAEGMVISGDFQNVLVVGGDRLSRITDYTDRATCILFGDGIGATLVRPVASGDRGLLSSYLKTDGTLANLLYRPGGGGNHPPDEKMLEERGYYIKMAGREVFKSAVKSMAEACDRALERAGVSAEEVDLLIPHQANIRIIEATAKHAGIPMEKVYVNIDRYGNTSAASIPIALDECVRCGRIVPGSLVLMVAFGGGFTWASALVRW
ncbi:MAG: ketoacyl-ACP synthase III [Gemmatimonadota bacterium]|nr:MAG: ketoacyl-ACP synthase III [Gemmatimonadota bacterium]